MRTSLLNEAHAAHADGRLAEAASLYQAVLRSNPDELEAMEGLGVVCFQQDLMERAITQFEQGISTHPYSARLHAKLGAAYRRRGRYEEARSQLLRAIELDGTLPDPWNSLGRLAFDERRFDDAEAAYRTAIHVQPEFAVAYRNLASTLLGRRCWVDAVDVLRAHLRIEPDDPGSWTNLARALGEQGDPALLGEAEAACRRALTVHPGYADALDILGNVLRVRGHLDEAVACYQLALQIDPRRASSHRYFGQVLQCCGRYAEAGRLYEAAHA